MSELSTQVYRVSQLTREVRLLLEQGFAQITVSGEISNFSSPSSGHWYFTLKDGQAQVRCALFRHRNQLVRFRPKDGDQVNLRCKVSLYEPRGDFQLIGDYLEPAGQGRLQLAFEQLKQRLASEGLFDLANKQSLPTHPQHITLITSPTGAAIRDLLSVLQRRCPSIAIDLIPVAVQGQEAAGQICRALALANRLQQTDVIILGRGGGSLEDLWPFNEESVARAIHASRIPVVSAVGHETDVTISDFVADVRAPTPSAAAELVAPDQQHWHKALRQLGQRLQLAIQRQLQQQQQLLQRCQQRLRHPQQLLQQRAQRLDECEQRLQRLLKKQLSQQQHQLRSLSNRLAQQRPDKRLQQQRLRLEALQQRLQRQPQQLPLQQRQLQQLRQRLTDAQQHCLQQARQQLQQRAQSLHLVSPLATLERGYAIVQTPQGQVLRRADEIQPGQAITIRLHHGRLAAQVQQTLLDSDKT